ncbi:hypothetical protein AB0B45_39230 [Nonomuraea sp. NPDC049152]|uniref:hypothetical protein n=1 Tax=Nonomuraea sp. NPDC049152 TaxID=3154350 RepID=UPI003409F7B4
MNTPVQERTIRAIPLLAALAALVRDRASDTIPLRSITLRDHDVVIVTSADELALDYDITPAQMARTLLTNPAEGATSSHAPPADSPALRFAYLLEDVLAYRDAWTDYQLAVVPSARFGLYRISVAEDAVLITLEREDGVRHTLQVALDYDSGLGYSLIDLAHEST